MNTGIFTPDYIAMQLNDYRRQAEDWRNKMLEIADMKMALSEARQTMKDFEARAIVNGEATGSNDKQRQAALDVYLASSQPYQDVLRQSRDVQQAIEEAEVAAEYANQQMRLIRLTVEWVTARTAAKE